MLKMNTIVHGYEPHIAIADATIAECASIPTAAHPEVEFMTPINGQKLELDFKAK